jgi:tRNA G18 (ribose-2'-O)-methylase SpoU
VLSVLQGGHRKLLSLYLSEKYLHNQSKRIERLIKLAKIRGLEIEYRSEENLDSFTAGRIHDGVIIKAEFRDFNHIKKNSKFLESLKKRTGNIIVLLDKVIDIQNYGSIARTCFYYGVDYLIVNKAHRPAISPALCQISLGACENMDLYCLKNFYPFIQGNISLLKRLKSGDSKSLQLH